MVHSQEAEHVSEGLTLKSYLSVDRSNPNPKPCILVIHDWEGRHEGMCHIADRLAELGYIGFAVDMYGDAKLGETKPERRALMEPLMANRKRIVERMQSAFDAVIQQPGAVADQVAALGYCFGGLCALDFARSGANLKGAVSFHGRLSAPESTTPAKITSKLLVHHGYDDPLVPKAQVEDFAKEMDAQKVDWQVHLYGGVQHSFTNPKAHDAEMGLFYDEKADHRSWQTTTQFLNEIFVRA